MDTKDNTPRPGGENGSTTANLSATVEKADAHTKLKLMRDVMIGPVDQLVEARNEKLMRDFEARERYIADRVDGLERRLDVLEQHVRALKESSSGYHGQAISDIGDALSGLSEKLHGLRERERIADAGSRH